MEGQELSRYAYSKGYYLDTNVRTLVNGTQAYALSGKDSCKYFADKEQLLSFLRSRTPKLAIEEQGIQINLCGGTAPITTEAIFGEHVIRTEMDGNWRVRKVYFNNEHVGGLVFARNEWHPEALDVFNKRFNSAFHAFHAVCILLQDLNIVERL